MRLDDDYANGAYIKGADSYPPKWQAMAESFRAKHLTHGDLAYGDSPRQVMDVFLPDGESRGLFVFVHGGYWKALDKSYWSHLAAGMLARGWSVAMPSYDLCPDVQIADITRQIAQAITKAAHQVAGPIILAGHSAGGHLVARMACAGVLPDDVVRRLQHVMPISPVSDLRPLLETSMNETFGLDMAGAVAESPALCTDFHDIPITSWVGSDERPAFLDQARWLAEAWGCGHVVDQGLHHFDVIDALANTNSAMVRCLAEEGEE
ncbi:Acetyl esterase/lipase [Shimia gijangensis]|uniref:Acetyl esterase/lipase n=1 Tax=Shimia gijangensis TaxID=1470563 RepID=A0A1M6BEP4_9RHOB|nr:alpha/beta hydrolase [Shimia gijangensis]SHI47212.1 Acetyl esterase/lipase [Shimia gijangensis]